MAAVQDEVGKSEEKLIDDVDSGNEIDNTQVENGAEESSKKKKRKKKKKKAGEIFSLTYLLYFWYLVTA